MITFAGGLAGVKDGILDPRPQRAVLSKEKVKEGRQYPYYHPKEEDDDNDLRIRRSVLHYSHLLVLPPLIQCYFSSRCELDDALRDALPQVQD